MRSAGIVCASNTYCCVSVDCSCDTRSVTKHVNHLLSVIHDFACKDLVATRLQHIKTIAEMDKQDTLAKKDRTAAATRKFQEEVLCETDVDDVATVIDAPAFAQRDEFEEMAAGTSTTKKGARQSAARSSTDQAMRDALCSVTLPAPRGRGAKAETPQRGTRSISGRPPAASMRDVSLGSNRGGKRGERGLAIEIDEEEDMKGSDEIDHFATLWGVPDKYKLSQAVALAFICRVKSRERDHRT